MCHDIRTKFHTDWFRDSKVDSGGFTDTDSMVDGKSKMVQHIYEGNRIVGRTVARILQA
jgi:hypothetical protein